MAAFIARPHKAEGMGGPCVLWEAPFSDLAGRMCTHAHFVGGQGVVLKLVCWDAVGDLL